jgi:hypothetical protein
MEDSALNCQERRPPAYIQWDLYLNHEEIFVITGAKFDSVATVQLVFASLWYFVAVHGATTDRPSVTMTKMLEKERILHKDRIRHVFIQLYDGVVLGYGVVLDEDG